MDLVGRLGSLISQGVYSVATPFHPFGGAVDIIVVKQKDDSYRSTPWHIRFGKFQGVLRGPEKEVSIFVNGIEANFHMYLDSSGQAYFLREDADDADEADENTVSNDDPNFGDNISNDDPKTSLHESTSQFSSGEDSFNLEDVQSRPDSVEATSKFDSLKYASLDEEVALDELQNHNSEMVLLSIDGHVLTAPISSTDANDENIPQSFPQFHLGPAETASRDIAGAGENWESHILHNSFTSKGKDETNNMPSSDSTVIEQQNESSIDQEVSQNSNDSIHEADEKNVANECNKSEEHVAEPRDEDIELDDASGYLVRSETFKSCLDLSQIEDEQLQAESPVSPFSVERKNCKPVRRVSFNEEKLDGTEATTKSSDCSYHSQYHHTGVKSSEFPADTDNREHRKSSLLPNHLFEDNYSGSPGYLNIDDKGNLSDIPEHVPSGENSNSSQGGGLGFEISLCGKLLQPHMGSGSAKEVFDANLISREQFEMSGPSIVKNGNLIVRSDGKYFPWSRNSHFILGRALFGQDFSMELKDVIPVDNSDKISSKSESFGASPSFNRMLSIWPSPFRRSVSLQNSNSSSSSEDIFLDTISSPSPRSEQAAEKKNQSPRKKFARTNIPTSEQIASLNLQEGQNMIRFVFSTRVLGKQQVEAHIYLWKWNTRIVISDVDGTITKSDVLGQVAPLIGRDWSQSGVARLFSAIKKNGYQLLFLSARAIVQAYLTKSFLFNLKQDGEALPNGPVVISPDGLLPSLYREVIRRAPHEFKIACLQDIRALFPADNNPFYAGFGNRDTDELSYRKIGIPKGKIFIINPKGEVAINSSVDVKSYSSLHTLVHDMFPPTSLVEQEDYNSWNYWKVPLPEIDL